MVLCMSYPTINKDYYYYYFAVNNWSGWQTKAFESSTTFASNAWLLSTACFIFITLQTGNVVQHNPSENHINISKEINP